MNEPAKGRSFLLIILFLLSGSIVFAQISVEPSSWDLGAVRTSSVYSIDVKLNNSGDNPVKVSLMSTCGCLTVDTAEVVLSPGQNASISLSYDTVDDEGAFEKILIIRTTDPSLPKGFFLVTGTAEVNRENKETADIADSEGGALQPPEGEKEIIPLEYYYMPGCRECSRFMDEELPRAAMETGTTPRLTPRDITDPDVYSQLEALLKERRIEWREVPVLVSERGVLQGSGEISANLSAMLSEGMEQVPAGGPEAAPSVIKEELFILSILAAGLLDGVNPCAFTTLIFLISALTVAGRGRREILVIGTFFTAAVFITYYLVGAGFFGALRMAAGFSVIASAIRWLLTAVLILFAIPSLIDYAKIKRGASEEILLQLPKSMKRRIHGTVREHARSTAIIGSSLVMGVLISLFELGCTGQIYLPTITHMIRRGGGISGWMLLAVYNLAFIIPLVGVFLVAYFGVQSKKMTQIFRKNLAAVKLLTALLFLFLAILTMTT